MCDHTYVPYILQYFRNWVLCESCDLYFSPSTYERYCRTGVHLRHDVDWRIDTFIRDNDWFVAADFEDAPMSDRRGRRARLFPICAKKCRHGNYHALDYKSPSNTTESVQRWAGLLCDCDERSHPVNQDEVPLATMPRAVVEQVTMYHSSQVVQYLNVGTRCLGVVAVSILNIMVGFGHNSTMLNKLFHGLLQTSLR